MKFGPFNDDGDPIPRHPEKGRPKALTADRIDAIARFVEERDTGSRNLAVSGIDIRSGSVR